MDHVDSREAVPILNSKYYEAPSVFTPENLLRETRRQKGLGISMVPTICVLDPDGDLVDHLHVTNRARRHPTWACYHSMLDTFMHEGNEYGIIGRVVGAPFAVLVAEELFASGCQFLISITSAGQIISMGRPPYVVLIEKALRDEGTSYHYQPPAPYSYLHPILRDVLCTAWDHTHVPLHTGASWTTHAPFRETEEMITNCRKQCSARIQSWTQDHHFTCMREYFGRNTVADWKTSHYCRNFGLKNKVADSDPVLEEKRTE